MKNIYFKNNGVLAYAVCGGRALIVNSKLEIVDFFLGKKLENRQASFKHKILGQIEAVNDLLKFTDLNCEIDFNSVHNSFELYENKIKHLKKECPWNFYVPIHLFRYAKKHLKQ